MVAANHQELLHQRRYLSFSFFWGIQGEGEGKGGGERKGMKTETSLFQNHIMSLPCAFACLLVSRRRWM